MNENYIKRLKRIKKGKIKNIIVKQAENLENFINGKISENEYLSNENFYKKLKE